MSQECKTDHMNPFHEGQYVRSKAGKDRGQYSIIIKVLDSKYVEVVDGKRRKLIHPKKKKILHLQPIHRVIENFEAMKAEHTFNDAKIRKLLRSYEISQEEAKNVK